MVLDYLKTPFFEREATLTLPGIMQVVLNTPKSSF